MSERGPQCGGCDDELDELDGYGSVVVKLTDGRYVGSRFHPRCMGELDVPAMIERMKKPVAEGGLT